MAMGLKETSRHLRKWIREAMNLLAWMILSCHPYPSLYNSKFHWVVSSCSWKWGPQCYGNKHFLQSACGGWTIGMFNSWNQGFWIGWNHWMFRILHKVVVFPTSFNVPLWSFSINITKNVRSTYDVNLWEIFFSIILII
jgi:hypothetical protein